MRPHVSQSLSCVLACISLCLTVNHALIHALNPQNPPREPLHSLHSRSLTSTGRRQVLTSTLLTGAALVTNSHPAQAAVTDETDAFADNWWSTPSSSSSSSHPATSQQLPSDEITIVIPKADIIQSGGLGLELRDIEFRTNLRVYIKSVQPRGLGRALGVQPDWVVVAVNDQSTERTNAEGVARMIQMAMNQNDSVPSISMTFRDPSAFRDKLQALSENESVTTQVAPAGDTTQRNRDGSVKEGRVVTSQANQQITVTQLVAPSMCHRGATTDDLLEISYVGRILETNQIFDGSAVKINNQGIPGRGNDVTIFFVLNKQPFGQFPPGWDVGLYGMCVGERRRVIIPPALAYGPNGVPRRNIPPNATLQYDVSLVSLNGLSLPQ